MNKLKGVVTAIVSSMIMALLFAYLFRLPIPFGGYIGPFGTISTYDIPVIETFTAVLVAWVLYGMLGGFPVLILCGVIVGNIVGLKYQGSNRKNFLIIVWVWGITIIPIFILSVLDYIIGPW